MGISSQPIINKIDKLPVVVLPLEEYEKMREDLEMLRSKKLPRAIEKARREVARGETMTLGQVKKLLNLS